MKRAGKSELHFFFFFKSFLSSSGNPGNFCLRGKSFVSKNAVPKAFCFLNNSNGDGFMWNHIDLLIKRRFYSEWEMAAN